MKFMKRKTLMSPSLSSVRHTLSKPTSFLGLKLWVAIIICIVIVLALLLFFTLLFIFFCHRKSASHSKHPTSKKPRNAGSNLSMNRRLLPLKGWDVEMSLGTPEKQVMYKDKTYSVNAAHNAEPVAKHVSGDLNVRPANHYTLRQIQEATNGFADENVIGSGVCGVVYRGVLLDKRKVAVKKLFSTRLGIDEFVKGVEAMWGARHRNLVKLLGYCAEGNYRMLVFEFIENGNLDQWLHQCISRVSPLTWNMRMKIIEGIAKGLAYLHEDTEPAIVHQHLKSSNILLDHQWNPKISDFGINQLLGPEWCHTLALPVGMSGYIAQEDARAGIFDEKSDVYSFGILIMEIISGKTAKEATVNEIEEYLIDWIKTLVADENFNLVVDPKLPQIPSSKELKRILLVALRCVDPDVDDRPKMGEIIHMLEPRDLLLTDEQVTKRGTSRRASF